MMAHLSIQQARAIVDDIRVTNGGFSLEFERQLRTDERRAFRNLQTLAGRSAVHVAEDLYDQDTRFIYELIQNAEDNRYSNAPTLEEPFLHFTLHQDRLTVDSNEDGFSEADVRAICSTHQSTKQQTGGYIGHKGIGFKSVFKIAYKVFIQSGAFCFSFEHRQGDSGMGMITPSNEEPESLPQGVKTRITLFLIAAGDFELRAKELKEIPDTLLLFLHKLQKLTLEIPLLECRISHKRSSENMGAKVTLTKETNGDDERRHYLLENTTLSDLPEHQSRIGIHETELILAFPVDMLSRPHIEPQYVYSFLPMRKEGFNFLIQSDFITQASRQGVHLCPRNYAIRDEIGNLFVQAIHKFCQHPALKYAWLQYLPGPHIQDPFWADLREIIFDALKASRVLLSRRGTRKCPKDLQRLSSRHCDRHGQPLFEDIDPEIYLSQSYEWFRDAESLIELGVISLSYNKILDRLSPYLEGQSPRFLDPTLDEDWHTKVANLILRGLKRDGGNHAITRRIKRMNLIPTSEGTLTSTSCSPVYFPDDKAGTLIPNGLKDVPIIAPSALKSPPRRQLVQALGVEHCESDKVVKAILEKYNRREGVTLINSVSHLSYLFRTLEKEDTLDKRIFVMDQTEQRIYRAFVTLGVEIVKDDVYFETMGEYGTKELHRQLQSWYHRQNIPIPKLHIIHSSYIDAVPQGTFSHGRTWEQWLEEVAMVRRIPRLRSPREDELSTLSQYLADYRPMALIGILKAYSSSYQSEFTPRVVQALGRMKVPCRNGSTRFLRETYYPSQELQRLCTMATVHDTFDHFLEVPLNLATENTDGWEFLATLGVGLQPDVRFFAFLFSHLVEKNMEESQTQVAIFELYKELYVRFNEAHDELIEYIFDDYAAVILPARSDDAADNVFLSDCVWNGLPCLHVKSPLAIHPQYSQNPLVAGLFKDVLRLPDADLDTYLEELQSCQGDPDLSVDDLRAIYGIILQYMNQPRNHGRIVDEFREQQLVYLPEQQVWVAPESCTWSDDIRVGVLYGISSIYPELEDFFCNFLNIQVPTAADYIDELKTLVLDSPVDVSLVKDTIHQVNSLGATHDELKNLNDIEFLPVAMPSGIVRLVQPTAIFFIADRVEYLAAFRGKVPILDFSIEECRRLHRLLESLGLDGRYMSTAVQEETLVDLPSQEPSSRHTREFRKMADPIYRCILHYHVHGQEPDGQTLQRLQRSLVYESSGFKRNLILQLNNVTAKVQSDTGLVHIEEVRDVLQIYIPRAPVDRQRCYSLDLPRSLRRHFRLLTSEAQLSLQLVFLARGELVDQLLDEHGIVRIPPDIAQLRLESHGNEELSGSEASETEENNDYEAASQTPEPNSRASSIRVSPATVPGQESPFSRLLSNVIRLARLHTLSDILLPSLTDVLDNENIEHEAVFGVRSQNQLEHDMKIGAAGELFVFELLLGQGLPGFDRTNWRSNIRKYVSVHPDYRDLTPWSGVETADLVYHDTSSVLTRILIRTGYLTRDRWHGINPSYYIEVKTTTGECDNAFFMSRSQYRRMQRMHLATYQRADPEIYVIFRVYNLGKENMRLKIYVDPESLRQEERLIFIPESYSVQPS
ncbi:uncharacterized protein BJX67DRAFT_391165 [Aspergillus lucknowensis]|uniref:Protein NO VEIN C-terminal domain-containing protein n=1 Tax=Aspergillus lucknowensis TaxID=176173 RepID=A0ABR4LDI4_9EURO